MTFRIDPEFKDYLGQLDDESRQALEESLLAEGCRDALVVWPQDDGGAILLDGHNRYEICEKLVIAYRLTNCPDTITGRDSAISWIVQNQRARRNLTPDQLRYLCGKIYQAEKKEPWRPKSPYQQNDNRGKGVQNEHLISEGKTEQHVASEFGISPATVRRNEKFAEQVDDVATKYGNKAKSDILAGRAKVADYYEQDRQALETLAVEPGTDVGLNNAPIPELKEKIWASGKPELIPGLNNIHNILASLLDADDLAVSKNSSAINLIAKLQNDLSNLLTKIQGE